MKKILLISLTFIVYLITGTIFWGNHKYMLFFTLLTVFLVSFFFIKNNKLKESLLYFVPFWFLLISFSLISHSFKYSILYIIFIPISNFLGIWSQNTFKFIKLLFSISLFLLLSIKIFPEISNLMINDSSFHVKKKMPNIILLDKNLDTIRFNKKIIVLDFWTEHCSVCYKKFPNFEYLTKKYRNEDIELYSVNVPEKGQTIKQQLNIIDKLNYNFKKTITPTDKIEKDLKFNTYPHIIIVKNDTLIYNGMYITLDSYINNKNNIEEIIDNILND